MTEKQKKEQDGSEMDLSSKSLPISAVFEEK